MTTFTTKLMQLSAHEGPFCVENFGVSGLLNIKPSDINSREKKLSALSL